MQLLSASSVEEHRGRPLRASKEQFSSFEVDFAIISEALQATILPGEALATQGTSE